MILKLRAEIVRKLFFCFLDVIIQPTWWRNSETDGNATLMVCSFNSMIMHLIVEAKKELGSTSSDPFMQGLANSYTDGIDDGLDRSVPCFNIVMAGPHFGVFVQYQQLTPLFSLAYELASHMTFCAL